MSLSVMDEGVQVSEIAAYLTGHFPIPVDAHALVIAGSGLGAIAENVTVLNKIEYGEIPHIGDSTVAGHAGELLLAETAGHARFVILRGRRHLYEGITAKQSTLLLRSLLISAPDLHNVIISNAAGALNSTFEVGDLMLISDHINWMFTNPLIGRNNPEWGERFPDMSMPYSEGLRRRAREVALANGMLLREGVYVANLGPSYETRAEFFMLRETCGGDAVGMSTIPEVLVARHAGREVLGISFISNSLVIPAVTSHEEVMENSSSVEKKFSALVIGVIDSLT